MKRIKWSKWSPNNIYLNCVVQLLVLTAFQRLILHLNIYLHEHFQVKRPLIKYWGHLTIKGKTSNMKSESDDVELQQKSSKLSPSQPGPLVHFPFHSAINSQCLPHWTKRPGSQIKCLLRNWKLSIPPGFSGEKYLDPLTPPTPPGLRLPGLFTSPPPPFVIRKQMGGGTSILSP